MTQIYLDTRHRGRGQLSCENVDTEWISKLLPGDPAGSLHHAQTLNWPHPSENIPDIENIYTMETGLG